MLEITEFNIKIFLLVVIVNVVLCARKDLVPMAKFASCQEFVTETDDCEHYFPMKSVKNYRDDNYKLHIKFYVFSFHDANVVLSSTKEKADCRLLIGGWSNTKSVFHCHGKNLDTSHIKNITSPMWPIPVVIRITTSGWLTASIPGLAEPLLSADVPDLKPDYICMHSYQEMARWFYNCAEDEDKLYDVEWDRDAARAEVTFDERFGVKSGAFSLKD